MILDYVFVVILIFLNITKYNKMDIEIIQRPNTINFLNFNKENNNINNKINIKYFNNTKYIKVIPFRKETSTIEIIIFNINKKEININNTINYIWKYINNRNKVYYIIITNKGNKDIEYFILKYSKKYIINSIINIINKDINYINIIYDNNSIYKPDTELISSCYNYANNNINFSNKYSLEINTFGSNLKINTITLVLNIKRKINYIVKIIKFLNALEIKFYRNKNHYIVERSEDKLYVIKSDLYIFLFYVYLTYRIFYIMLNVYSRKKNIKKYNIYYLINIVFNLLFYISFLLNI